MKRELWFFVPFVVSYLHVFSWMWESWHFREGYYEHAPFVVAVAAFVLWQRREVLGEIAARRDARGYLLLGPGLFIHLAGSLLSIDSLSALSLLLTVPGLCWTVFGFRRTKAMAPVLGLLFFIIPMPIVVTGQVVFQLKEFAVDQGITVANWTGLAVERARENLQVPGVDTPLFVANACGGLRSLLSLTTLGYGLAFLMGEQRGPRRWLLLLASAPLAVLMNIVRIAGLCWIARLYGAESASGTGHDVLNGVIWVVDLAALILLDQFLSRKRRGGSSKGATA
ncbi:MAG: exosortase/archaeosortase family protein [Planctomycetota bacterium]